MAKETPKTTQISVRLNTADLEAIEAIGQAAQPVPVARNAMVGVAVREYVERNAKAKPKK